MNRNHEDVTCAPVHPPAPMMTCGHAANAKRPDGSPSCAICICSTVDEHAPDLTGRRARCSYYAACTSEAPSATGLAFFEYRGPGSRSASRLCADCDMVLSAHWPEFHVTLRCTLDDGTGRDMTSRVRAQDVLFANGAAAAWAEKLHAGPDLVTGKSYRSIVLASVVALPRVLACTTFREQGGQAFDSFYCGCRGWN